MHAMVGVTAPRTFVEMVLAGASAWVLEVPTKGLSALVEELPMLISGAACGFQFVP